MDRIRTKLIIVVTSRLAAAPDSNAKTDLIEELSDNLYQRYCDMVGMGMDEEAAYQKALDELGDVDELLAYLHSLGPDGELPRQEGQNRDYMGEFFKGAEEVFRETVSQTKDAMGQAKGILKDVAKNLKEKYPHGFDYRTENGHVTIHVDSPGDGGARVVENTVFSSQNVTAIDVNVVNGDVHLHLLDDPEADVIVEGDTNRLELSLSDAGILYIRQNNTASSFFLFGRDLVTADVELYLPKRIWESIAVTTVSGDVELPSGLDVRKLDVKTASGDVELQGVACPDMRLHTAGGDIDGRSLRGEIKAEAASGDMVFEGDFSNLEISTASGDVRVMGSVAAARCNSASGDISIRTGVMPHELNLTSRSGDCEVRIPDGQGFTLRFRTVSGDIRSEFPMVAPMGAKSGNAVYLGGGESVMNLSTVSGDISMKRQQAGS